MIATTLHLTTIYELIDGISCGNIAQLYQSFNPVIAFTTLKRLIL